MRGKYLYCALAALVLTVGVMGHSLKRQRESMVRYRHNQSVLLAEANDSLEHYRTKSHDYAVSIGTLELTRAELERNCTRLAAEVEDMGIRLKRVQEATTTATSTRVEIVTQVRDSIVYVIDSIGGGHVDSLRYLHWQDPWVDFLGELRGDTLSAQVESRDTLLQVAHRVPRRFLFFRWGTKEIRQEIKTSNPHTIIIYAESIRVK